MSVLRLNYFCARAGQFEALAAVFEDLVSNIRALDGYLRCELLLNNSAGNPDNDGTVIVLEEWDSIAAHKAAAAKIDPVDFARIMPLLNGRPHGQYYTTIDKD